jgi:hypothetical protein
MRIAVAGDRSHRIGQSLRVCMLTGMPTSVGQGLRQDPQLFSAGCERITGPPNQHRRLLYRKVSCRRSGRSGGKGQVSRCPVGGPPGRRRNQQGRHRAGYRRPAHDLHARSNHPHAAYALLGISAVLVVPMPGDERRRWLLPKSPVRLPAGRRVPKLKPVSPLHSSTSRVTSCLRRLCFVGRPERIAECRYV